MKTSHKKPESVKLSPMSIRASNAPDDHVTLLKQHSVRNSTEIHGNVVILSIEDILTFGMSGDIQSLSSDYLTKRQVSIFAEQISIVDDFKAKNAVVSGHSLNVANEKVFLLSGQDGTNSDIPVTAESSHDGANAGSVAMYMENPTEKLVSVKANGGGGGMGKKNAVDGTVGNGGNGGDGGNVTIYTTHPCQEASDGISDILLLDPKNQADVIWSSAKLLVESSPDDMKEGYLLNINNLLGTSKDIAALISELVAAKRVLDNEIESYIDTQKAFIEVNGGEGGILTVSDSAHHDGNHGKVGSKTVNVLGSVPKLLPKFNGQFLPVHPVQCAMMLNQAKLQYILLNYNDESILKSQVTNLVVLLNRLDQRTKVFIDLKKTDSLYLYYSKYESDFGAFNSVEAFQGINQEVQVYINHLKQGLDFFGYSLNYVPLKVIDGVPNVQDVSAIGTLLEMFRNIEETYVRYLKDLSNGSNFRDTVKQITDSLNSSNSDILKNDIPFLHSKLPQIAEQIAAYKDQLEEYKKDVESNITKYKHAIDQTFNFNIASFLDAVSTIAFAPESPAMWVAAGAKLLQTSISTIPDNNGNPVQKEYIVHEISQIGDDLKSIGEGYTARTDGTIELEDPGANKLLGEQQKIEGLLEQFYDQCQNIKEELTDSLKNYISMVIKRNNLVMEYNACVCLLQQKLQTLKSNENKLEKLNDENLGQDPDLPYNAVFALEAYNVLQNEVIGILNFASRIYRFWKLDLKYLCTVSGEGVDHQNPPVSLNYDALLEIYNNFYSTTILSAGNSSPAFTSSFTGSKDSKTAAKTFYYGKDYFTKIEYGVRITIEAQKKETADAAFSDMANVRISNVRVYLEGAKMKQGHEKEDVTINITHGADDNFTAPDNTPVSFKHEKISLPFKYNTSTKEESVKASFAIMKNGAGAASFCVLGPFTEWTIQVDPKGNPNLDYDSIKGITIEFDGICSGFQAAFSGFSGVLPAESHADNTHLINEVSLAGAAVNHEVKHNCCEIL